MTRRVAFSAAHYVGTLSDEAGTTSLWTRDSPIVHGHNYTLDVSVQGKIDVRTGILINIKEIDRIATEKIVQLFDGKLINLQVEDFHRLQVTPENLIRYFRVTLKDGLPTSVQLCRLRLAVTPTYSAEWQADGALPRKESGAMFLTRGYEFAASHRLHSPHLSTEENRELFGKCNYEYGHGHNYEVEVTVVGPIDPRSGRVIDPDVLDEIVQREVIERYDHRHFNYDIPEFAGLIPSAETITGMIWNRLERHIPAPARLYRVLIRETARNIFEYFGEA